MTEYTVVIRLFVYFAVVSNHKQLQAGSALCTFFDDAFQDPEARCYCVFVCTIETRSRLWCQCFFRIQYLQRMGDQCRRRSRISQKYRRLGKLLGVVHKGTPIKSKAIIYCSSKKVFLDVMQCIATISQKYARTTLKTMIF